MGEGDGSIEGGEFVVDDSTELNDDDDNEGKVMVVLRRCKPRTPTRLIDFPGPGSAFSAFNFPAMPARALSNSAIRRAAP